MKTSTPPRFLLLCAALSILSMCKIDRQDTAFIQPPFQQVNVPFHDFTISANDEKKIELPNGTHISIPSQAFVDREGKPVTGQVELLYREFQSAADIIASGIPMTYDSAGTTIQFESAGMFEINAKQGNEPVYIAKGKNIEVSMASFKEGNNYNSYSLDTVKKNWEYQGCFLPKVNEVKKKELEILGESPVAPVTPKKYDGVSPVFYIEADYSSLPELKEFSGVIWQYCAKEGTSLAIDKWVYNQTWSDATIKPSDPAKGEYTLCLKAKNKEFSTLVSPVLKGENFEKEMGLFRERMNSYKAIKETRINEEARIQTQGDLLRTFSIDNFGIYNCDRQFRDQNVVRFVADFDLGGVTNEGDIDIFLIINNAVVIKYSKFNKGYFGFNPSDYNRLIAVLPGNQIATFSNEEFQKIDTESLKEKEKAHFTFRMHTEEEKISSFKQLERLISI